MTVAVCRMDCDQANGGTAEYDVRREIASRNARLGIRGSLRTAVAKFDQSRSANPNHSIVNVFALLVPPPGVGVTTLMLAVPAVLMSLLGTVAVNVALLTQVVVSFFAFQWITEVAKSGILTRNVSFSAVWNEKMSLG
jgi:hypothetical protein